MRGRPRRGGRASEWKRRAVVWNARPILADVYPLRCRALFVALAGRAALAPAIGTPGVTTAPVAAPVVGVVVGLAGSGAGIHLCAWRGGALVGGPAFATDGCLDRFDLAQCHGS